MDKQKVADYLLKEGYLLTALELHVELSEKGSALPSLTTFFKESKNFESFISKTSPQSSVSGSQAGLDDVSSLFDLTRNSEDSHVQAEDRVAVLEFELRKARETIFNLREELTSKVNQNQDHDYIPLLHPPLFTLMGTWIKDDLICSVDEHLKLP